MVLSGLVEHPEPGCSRILHLRGNTSELGGAGATFVKDLRRNRHIQIIIESILRPVKPPRIFTMVPWIDDMSFHLDKTRESKLNTTS